MKKSDSKKLKHLFRVMIFGWLFFIPLYSAQANECVCHNIGNKPHTICVGDAGFLTHLFGHLNIENDTPGPCCGNNECEMSDGEDCSTCSKDCGECGPSCGDGECNGSEDCGSCSQDCGECCGDGSCDEENGEDCTFCPEDCGECQADCGNGIQEEGEECDEDAEGNAIGCDDPEDPTDDDIPCNTDNDLCVCMRCGNGIVAEGEDCEFDSQCQEGFSCGDPGTIGACLCQEDSGQGFPNRSAEGSGCNSLTRGSPVSSSYILSYILLLGVLGTILAIIKRKAFSRK